MPAPKVVVLTGASSGFGALTARRLAQAGHTVYAGIRATTTRNASSVSELERFASEHDVTLHALELDVASQSSADAAVAKILAEQDRLDVVIHNAGHMVLGPSEAFTPEQIAEVYDVNVLGTQRVNRAALPHMRRREGGRWCGWEARARAVARRRSSDHTSPPRRRWTHWPSATPRN